MNQDKIREMVKTAYQALDDKKGEDIRIINVSDISVLADYFIIANGTNESQVAALVDNVKEELYKIGCEPRQIEGIRNKSWILMDYNDVIIHVFSKDDRIFYDLERIWKDGKVVEVTDL